MKTIIITASDAKYFELVQGTILSIREKQPGKTITIGFFDLGCNEEQLARLKTQVNIIIKPDWDFDFPTRNEVPEYLKGLLTRPFLRRYFPDFEVYIWIDADAWVQNWQAVELLILGAMKRGLAVIPELDRSYNLAYGKLPWYWQFVYRDYQSVFDEETAKKLYSYPVINAGVFALHRDAPHWQMWEKLLRQALQKNAGLMTDQVVLNFLVYNTELSKQTEMLPAWCNWSCNFGLPIWDVEKLCFVEPSLPHVPIGIIHLTGKKHDVVTVSTNINTLTNQSLRYPIKNSNHQVMTNLTNIEIFNKKNKRDYVSPGLHGIKLDPAFPNIIIGNTDQQPWQYLRREIPHNWYVDGRHPFVGFLSRDEAHILYNTALKFTEKRALEIGCWMGWSACHLIAAGVNLDIVDPMLEKPEFQQSVINSLQATTRITGISTEVSINAGYSPQAVLNLATQHQRKWSLIFIDGNHDAPGPLNDAIACEPLAEDTAMVLFHDLASPDVAQGLDYLQQKGWKTMVYQTMQIMGVAWRGDIEPVKHQPDPQVNWVLPKHLAHHPVKFV